MKRTHTRTLFFGAAAISAMALIATSGIALGQEEEASPAAETPAFSPLPTQAPEAMTVPHPLHIHSGTCEQLGDVVFPLGEISQNLMINGEPAAGSEMGASIDQHLAVNVTVVAATIEDLTAQNHAINIHQSEDDMGTYIACGDIAGTMIMEETLIIRLDEETSSGYVGVAFLRQGEDDTTTVYSVLTERDAMVESPQPEPTQAPETEATPDAEATPEPPAEGEAEATGDPAEVTVDVNVDAEGDGVDVEVNGPEETPAA